MLFDKHQMETRWQFTVLTLDEALVYVFRYQSKAWIYVATIYVITMTS